MWWTKHFRLPSTHEAFLNATLDDLYVEYYEQSFIERPIEAHRRTPDSDIVFAGSARLLRVACRISTSTRRKQSARRQRVWTRQRSARRAE
jgi:hypothetical protein